MLLRRGAAEIVGIEDRPGFLRQFPPGVKRVAVLPFNDDISAPELAHQLSDDVFQSLQYQLGAKHFQFTRLIGQDQGLEARALHRCLEL